MRMPDGEGEGDVVAEGQQEVGEDMAGPDDGGRTGLHNIVIGPEHSYSSYGGFIAGHDNIVSGGRGREADSPHDWVAGGLIEDL